MPTPEEIKNLIRQYAVGSATKHFSAELIESIVMGFYTSRLMYDYCIVSKSKVEIFYKVNQSGILSGGMTDNLDLVEYSRGRNSQLKDLFGELFKDKKI